MEWLEAVGIAFGVAAFFWNLVQWWIERREKRPKIDVALHDTRVVRVGAAPLEQLWIYVHNREDRAMVITDVGLLLQGGRILDDPFRTQHLPTEIAPGGHLDVAMDKPHVACELVDAGHVGPVQVRAFCKDRVQSQYQSKPLTIDLDSFQCP
jgi:hypothetical protein